MKEKEYLIHSIISNLVDYLVSDYRMDILTAFRTVYHSVLFQKLNDADTGLYIQSPKYVYTYLQHEIETGKCA